MDKRSLRQYLSGHMPISIISANAEEARRFCHTCGTALARRVYHGINYVKRSSTAKTESKTEFAARHFCNALCRAACKGSRIATIPVKRSN